MRIQVSDDGGATFRKLTEGLPSVELGRIEVDWYRSDPNVVFALVETAEGAANAEEIAAVEGVDALFVGRADLAVGHGKADFFDPDVAEIFYLRAQIQQEQNNKAKVIENLETAIQKNPYYVEAMNNLAIQYLLSGNYQAAIEQLVAAGVTVG